MELKRVASSPRTPTGYRLATYREIVDKMDKLNAQGLLSESRSTRVLDGIVCGGADLPITRNLLAARSPKHMLVISESSQGVPGNNLDIFRKHLYSGITLDDKRRENALNVACKVGDVEVIHWLRCSSNASQLIKMKESFEETKSSKPCSLDFYTVGKMVLYDNPGQKEMADALVYALQCEESVEYAIAIAEIVLDACSQQRKMDIVYKLIQRIAKTKVDSPGDAKRTALLTKLLSASPRPREDSMDIIEQWFPKLLSEACRRRYMTLAHELYVIYKVDLAPTNEFREFDSKTEDGEPTFILHAAAACGEVKIVKMLLSHVCVKDTDNQGRTPLHLAAEEGHVEMVTCLLNSGSDPLQERDMKGKTALHYAVLCRKGPETAKQLVDVLVGHYESDEKKAFLLLHVSASGIGTAEEIAKLLEAKGIQIGVVKHLKDIRTTLKGRGNGKKTLFKEAVNAGNPGLAWDFLNRGGNIKDIDWIPQNVRKQIQKYMEQGIDRPTYTDTLGRKALAECVAEHFLNSHIKSPITVCISGGSGMGKTSLMNQIKAYLQITYSQLVFPYLWKYEKISGGNLSLCAKGERMLHKIEKGVKKLIETKKDIGYGSLKEKPIVQFLSTYRPEYESVYKSLACMDFAQLLKDEDGDSGYRYQGENMGAAPRVLTVDFNAGMYRGNNEAWAGLAVKISKAIEDSMTWAQRLSTSWRNARRIQSTNFFVKFILPGLLLTILAAWLGWALWLFLDRKENQKLIELKYGSIPATIIVIVWGAVGQARSIFKPVSSEMKEYFKVRDYSEDVSYQEKVIADIKFLKREIGRKPFTVFSLVTGERWNNWFGLLKDNIKDTSNPKYESERKNCFELWFNQLYEFWVGDINYTSIPKYGSAPEGKLQIIAFVDDLDHCENEAVLKVLWSINLVFRECDINFVLAVDKDFIQVAFRNSPESQGEDSVDHFISKIIQLPVNLADPADDEWKEFLEEELGIYFDDETKYEASENDASSSGLHLKHAAGREMSRCEGCIPYSYGQLLPPKGNSEDVEAGSNQSENGIAFFFQKILSWAQWFLCILYVVACNDRNENDESYANKSDLRKSNVLSARILEVRASLMLTYTKDEIHTFDKLREFAAGKQRFPREWKCFIKYHKFARNVILKKARKLNIVYRVSWQAEFVAWTYICVHWKPQMNILIKQWHNLTQKENTPAKDDESQMNILIKQLHNLTQKENTPAKDDESSPKIITSLKKVVHKYKTQRWPHVDEKGGNNLTRPLHEIEGVPKISAEVFNEYEIKCGRKATEIEFNYKTTQSKIDAAEEEEQRWDDLYSCLDKVQDVPLKSLRIFQEFRFHCDARNLKVRCRYEDIVAKEETLL